MARSDMTLEKIGERLDSLKYDLYGLSPNAENLRDALINLAEIVSHLLDALKGTNQAALQAANTASCLANGIKPD